MAQVDAGVLTIQFDIGSISKGYSIDSSDKDIIIVTKCTPEKFMDYLYNRTLLVNNHTKTVDGNSTSVDLYKALHGIYTGRYYYLGVFTTKEDFLNTNGTYDMELYTFTRELTRLRINNILKTMMMYKIKGNNPDAPKFLLMTMFHLAYTEYWLKNNDFPDCVKLPSLLQKCNTRKKKVYRHLMRNRRENTVPLQRDIDYINNWQYRLKIQVSQLPATKNRYDVLKIIIMYMLGESNLYIPEINKV
ncbi:HE65 [Chrysodeixis chalcites nucleopolyhedrovirus]|uniref:HE65 n=1 Tax=Chrysodeixis chalcites nucleopolyhedrovirus TaxID=320432 RepID=Q4KT07_9ABAC|nr:HE65 [Chrysodeixis chalcites nucleopolyhedrovirus]AGC36287.1 HE65 protein [Chrysodeixis chalcites SNPV TF1-A]AAY84004.1 HE65 [Chrysodeixis chalcites nucleopolyhedrovirus]AGE61334.1 HE65 protein [Chrysodeixis chalcites nucleopolyhedrovirus]AGE61482.1 HE65 protein [Chrysodeixis chalcites nucleopolyhedrovirus]AGE61633.1 HE65 protein [Chrysodeixis chalcites nucleopolyhedrovirus]